MQKYWCIGREEHIEDERIISTWPSGFVKTRSSVEALLKSKAKHNGPIVAIWVAEMGVDTEPVLVKGEPDLEKDRRVPRIMYAEWNSKYASKTKPRQKITIAESRIKERARKKEEEESKKNRYTLPYSNVYAPKRP
jgi:hypothetical protein